MKNIILAIVLGMTVTFSTGAFAEAAQMWRIAVTGVAGEDMGIATVKEIKFFEADDPDTVGTDESTVNMAGMVVLVPLDSASTNQLGTAIPVVGSRAIDAAFDNNPGSKFRTKFAVGTTNNLYMQYTWHNNDNTRWPDVATYSITVDTVAQSPSTWTLQRNTGGKWVTVDSQFSVTFEVGEEKTFTVSP